jgi:hypothetical protein
MADRREIGRMEDLDGVPVIFSVNLDGTLRVEIGPFKPFGAQPVTAMADLDGAKTDQFGRLFITGAWSAGVRSAHLDAQETHEADGGDTMAEPLDPLCRGGDHAGCIGPPGTSCACPCHTPRTGG